MFSRCILQVNVSTVRQIELIMQAGTGCQTPVLTTEGFTGNNAGSAYQRINAVTTH